MRVQRWINVRRNDMVSALQVPVKGIRKSQKIFLERVRDG